ncbi:phosphoribosylglycinamide synthetase [Aliidiomarina minuta]|uniref:Phosphoribosylglycinamide synthetase n=1 Tax=Aliidiomarina minuta TaxID=880057 RepID=A0A432W890_9GAMM|nr:ATP-grasp domain-containing protein [Aliidiomarina minuta]RUO26272.1 phosphoribosylglycinamide synthetase [Aliidiomarina minuta]
MNEDIRTAIVLGGTEPHISLINELKENGYFVVLVDYTDSPPAKGFADRHIISSTLDYDSVLKLANDLAASIVISTCVDQANVVASYVSEKLNLPRLYSFKTAVRISKKSEMKDAMMKLGIPTSRYVVSVSGTRGYEALCLPLIVKPSDCTGSKGVVKVDTYEEVDGAVEAARSLSPSDTVIIEEFVDGEEVQLDFLIVNGKPNFIMSRQKVKGITGKGEFQQSSGSTVPANLTDQDITKFSAYVEKLANEFDLGTTPFFIQALVNKESISVIEFAPRIGGGLSHRLIKAVTGVDIIAQSLNAHLNKPIESKVIKPNAVFRTGLLYSHGGIFGKLEGQDECLSLELIECFVPYKKEGEKLGSDLASRNRVAAFISKADNQDSLEKKVRSIFDKVKIYDINGLLINR